MSRKKDLAPVLEEKIKIDPKGLLVVERPQADLGFLNVEIKGEDAGRILFDRRKGKLQLWFNQSAFAVDTGESKRVRKQNLEIRRAICEKLGGIDENKSQ